MHHIIIVAGGKGERMASTLPKQFLPLNGKPVLMHTIEAFQHCTIAFNIVLVLHPEMHDYWQSLCEAHAFTTPLHLVSGGATRYHSVCNGLNALTGAKATDIVLVHDAVRPFVSTHLINRVIAAAAAHGAAIPVVPVVDSLRLRHSNGHSTALDRSHYCAVQTPQAFRLELLRRAYEQPFCKKFTDDASVVEALGTHIALTEGEVHNFKLTTPLDFALAQTLLAQED